MGPYSMACEVLPQGRCKHVFPHMQTQGKKISSDHQNNIIVKYTDSDIILDCQIKTHDDWVATVEFLQETGDKKVQSATAPCKKNINDLHVELSHPCHH